MEDRMTEFDLLLHIRRQMAWSLETFGPDATGQIPHIRKELTEIEAANGADLEEWIDVMFLAIDGATRRAHATPEQIADMLERKLAKNRARRWPDWRTHPPRPGVPTEHIRESAQPCGCDPAERYSCSNYPNCGYGRAVSL
jgi:dATP/dGTP diphosphohydrolase